MSAKDREARDRRADARSNRDAILKAAAERLRTGQGLKMQDVAVAAGVSRSTVHRHFPARRDLDRALQAAALSAARNAVDRASAREGPPLALLRRLIGSLVEVGADHAVRALSAPPDGSAAERVGVALVPLAEELRVAAELSPNLPESLMESAMGQLVHGCLDLGGSNTEDPGTASEALFHSLADQLDRGLVVLDAAGSLLAMNPPAEEVLAPGERLEPGERLIEPRVETLYEDGGRCPEGTYPLATAVRTGEAPPATVRGHRQPDGATKWARVEVWVLRRAATGAVYGVVGALSDVTSERQWQQKLLRPPGELGRDRPVPLDIGRVLDKVPPHLFPDQLVSETRRLTGGPAALYVLDIDGSHLLRLAGAEEFPTRLQAPLALGPEVAPDGVPDLRARLEAELPGVAMTPMWLRGRAVGVLLSLRGSEDSLVELARHGAAAMELADGYTDFFDAARRRKETSAAAELQQSLLPPRIARLGRGQLAGGVLPSYEVGGDWFDYVENRDGAWISIADAVGKGPTAGALGGIALAALRAARRSEQGLEEAAQAMHEVIHDVGRPEFFVTALVARWHAVYSTFSWISCGHPPPLVAQSDGTIEQLMRPTALPLGLLDRERRFTRHQRRLEEEERLILHSDGITARRTPTGLFGLDGIEDAVREAPARSATAIARAVQGAVMSASVDPLQDDAVVVVLAPNGANGDFSRGD